MSGVWPLMLRDLKKWYRNPVFFFTGLIQPFFWIALFGSALSKLSSIPGVIPAGSTYITYIVGGVLTITALFTGMFTGTNIIFDRRLGPMGRFLSSPITRSSIVFSRVFSAILRILVQSVILVVAALLLPNGLIIPHDFSILDGLVIVAAIILVSLIFSCMFSVIAIRMREMNTIFGIVNLVNLPLLFMSYAMFPTDLMAGWIGDVAKYNPVSWSAEAIRSVILNGSLTAAQWGDVGLWLGGLAIIAGLMMGLTYVMAETEIRD